MKEELINSLFDEALKELGATETTQPLEISLSRVSTSASKEELDVLFSLAEESLLEGGTKTEYVDKIVTSDTRTVIAETLSKEIERVTKLSSTPVYSLQNISNSSVTPKTESINRGTRTLSQSPTLPRTIAFSIDCFITLLLSFGTAVTLHYSLFGTDGLGLLGLWDGLDFLTFSVIFALAFVFFYFTYPLLSMLLRVRPLGLALMDLRIRRIDGDRIRLSNALVRLLTFPLSVVTFGFTPIFFGKPPLHDILARTIVCEA